MIHGCRESPNATHKIPVELSNLSSNQKRINCIAECWTVFAGKVFHNSYNDSQVSKKSKNAERYVDDEQNEIMYKGGSVVAWEWYKVRYTAH